MKKIKFTSFLILLLVFPLFSTAEPISQNSALQVAKNFYFEQTNISADKIQFENIFTKNIDNETYYYVFNIEDNKGFVIVSAEEKYYPVIGYSPVGKYLTLNQPLNISLWMNQYIEQISYLRNNPVETSDEIYELWQKYNVPTNNFVKSVYHGKSVDPLAGDILWDQGNGWNALCPEDGAGPGGHVWAGCVATAMGIVMKYWNYPIHGTGSHSYYSGSYGVLSANFGDATYFWNNMDNTEPNLFSAHLLYHLGVSVNMSYGPDGSGAFSSIVDDALEDYFQYSTDAQYVERSYYTQTEWINLLKAQIDAGKPVYYSGRDDDNGGHAFVCSGYTDTDLFHFNFGWSGSNNGYYTVNDVGGFYIQQAAVINIEPAQSAVYPKMPNSITTVLNPVSSTQFDVDISWEAPVTKDIASYLLYRDFEQIAEVPASTYTYTDNNPDPANYYYSVSAKYTGTEESLTVSDYFQGMFVVTFYALDPEDDSQITSADVTFNGEVKPTTFVGAVFSDVAYGGSYLYSISHLDYPTTSGHIDVDQNKSVYVYMDGSNNIDNIKEVDFKIFPNPADVFIHINLPEDNIDVDYRIYDVAGKLIMSDILNIEDKHIEISSLNNGFYILKLSSENINISKSFIKQ